MREIQTEPRVSVRLELAQGVGHGAIELVVRNEGQGPATSVRFRMEGDPTYFVDNGIGKPIDEIPVIKNGLPYLGPDQNFRILLGWLFGDAFDRASQGPWVFHINYQNLSGNQREDTHTLDFSQFSGLIVGDGPPLAKIEKHLDSLRKEVGHMATGFHKLHVLTETKEELDRRQAEALRERRERQAADSSQTPSASSREEDTRGD